MDDSLHARTALRESARLRGFDVIEVETCGSAVEAVRNHRPDLVLLALEACGDQGLKTLHDIRDEEPGILVVLLVTGGEAKLAEGLDLGAVNFLKKPLEPKEVAFLLNELYLAIEDEADIRQVIHLVARRKTRLSFPGTPSHLSRIAAYLGREVRNHYPGLRVPVTEIKLALYEALANAVEHGNLEIDFDQKTRALDNGDGLGSLVNRRLSDPRLGRRRVHIEVDYLPDRVVYKVRDEGAGFRPEHFDRTRALLDTSALHGRGIALIQHYMDKVVWNARGNEIRMTRRIVPRARRGGRRAEGGNATESAPGPRTPGDTPPPRSP